MATPEVTVSDDSCFGKEYYASDGVVGECDQYECRARVECKKICDLGSGILHDRRIRLKKEEQEEKQRKKDKRKKDREQERKILNKMRVGSSRKRGYDRPQKLEYKNEGCLRDDMVDIVETYLVGTDYSMRRTRNIQSVAAKHSGPLSTEYLFKIDTRRKKSILCFIRDNLATQLSDRGFTCRSLYDTERACYPNYLEWVIQIRSTKELNVFLEELDL